MQFHREDQPSGRHQLAGGVENGFHRLTCSYDTGPMSPSIMTIDLLCFRRARVQLRGTVVRES
jgi:hypothetical protein